MALHSNIEVVKNEYIKNKNLKQEDVQSIQEWAEKQPHLPKISEMQIIIFLHRCNYSNESAKQRIDLYFSMRTLLPDVFANRNPVGQSFIDMTLITILPNPTPEGYRILYYRYLDYDYTKHKPTDRYKLSDMIYSLNFYQEGTCEGYVGIFDCDVATLRQIAETDFLKVKKFIQYIQKALPTRTKGIHIINPSVMVTKFLPLVKPFMSEKMKQRLHIHDKIETLLQYVPPECLPQEYGGALGTIKEIQENAKKNLLANSDFFVEEEKQIVDESKRIGKSPHDFITNGGYGTEGTFKKLDLD